MNENYPSSTIVSILPYEIRESKPNLYPGNFTIPAGDILNPGLLRIGVSRFYIPMAFGAPSMTAHSPSYEVARSVVNDYVGALIDVNPECKPGLFVVDRVYKSQQEAKEDLMNELPKHLEAQKKWFFQLVNSADSEFSKHKQPQSISDLQKLAAHELKLKDKAWLQDFTQLALDSCPACYAVVNSKAVICGSCRFVLDPMRYKSMQFATAEVVNSNSPVAK